MSAAVCHWHDCGAEATAVAIVYVSERGQRKGVAYCDPHAEQVAALGINLAPRPHRTTPMVDPWTDRTVNIDVACAPAVEALWALGIETTGCCQGGRSAEDDAVICFAGPWPWWSRFRAYRPSKQGAAKVATILHGLEPHGIWRRWDWRFDSLNDCSAVLLPTEDLAQLAQWLEAAADEGSNP
jgi:hypothetical protein